MNLCLLQAIKFPCEKLKVKFAKLCQLFFKPPAENHRIFIVLKKELINEF